MAVSREIDGALRSYLALLEKWNRAINLVSPNTIPDAWNRHFVDSLQLLPLIPDHIKIMLDIGSGAGFPGLVIAVARPDIHVHLLESDQRKCTFMDAVRRELSLSNVTVHCDRIENFTADFIPDMISARALASLDALLAYVSPYLSQNPALECLFPKGKSANDEIAEAQKTWSFDIHETASKTAADAKILHLSNILKKIS